ncbi:MAG TPA: FkbM family methyltransferase [Hyphomicrobiales bacterium]|nr:FkbM family methyltransferase [Kaistiaceae bacterium]HQF31175.1 FkbM family methyltransferase [Hyphomicrobiales bacterium]
MGALKKKLRKYIPFPKRKTFAKWFPPFETRNLVHLVNGAGITFVLDVGANRGQYAERLRSAGYQGRILSFEPLSGPRAELEKAAARDAGWMVYPPAALGAAPASVTINVYRDDSLSSIHDFVPAAAGEKGRDLVSTETVPVVTLDAVFAEFVRPDDKVYLKIDVQGAEREVLAGASGVLDRIAGLQVELPLAPMYEGEATMIDLLAEIDRLGFKMKFLVPVTNRRRLGPIDQIDGVFLRD